MSSITVPRVKICCISSLDEARMAIAAGASAIGLVSQMPSGPGIIPEALIAKIAAETPPGVGSFLLTSLQSAQEVVEQQRRLSTNTIQICDRLLDGSHADLRRAMPGISIVQVIHVNGPEAIEESMEAACDVDAILLDSGNQQLAVKELGGTGRAHDWNISRNIRERLAAPVFLAGGLTPENVGRAVRQVRPYGIDVCNGVRTKGQLDPAKLNAFMASVRAAAENEDD